MIRIADFVSRHCREKNHSQCVGRWTGMGIEVLCNCRCNHGKLKGNDQEANSPLLPDDSK